MSKAQIQRVVHFRQKGENSIRLDIDNEMDMVQTDSTGKVVTARTVETICHLYDGSSEVQLATADITASGATKTLSGKGVKLSWTFAVGSTFTDQTKTITCTKDSVDYTAVLTILASKGQPIYQLRPSAAAISFQRNADNTLTPASKTVGLSILKIDGNSTAELTQISQAPGLKVVYDTTSMPPYSSTSTWSSGSITVANTASNLYIAMYNSSQVLLDKETIPVVFDGNNGTSPYVADLTNQMDSVYVDSESLTVVRQSASTQVMMFYGSQQVNFTIESVQRKYDNGDGTTTTINQPSGTKVYGVTVGFAAAAAGQRGVSVQYDADKQVHGTETFAITIKPAQGTTDTFEVDFTINAVRGTYYNLIPAEKAIRATRNDSGALVVNGSTTYSMTCTYIMKNPLTGVTSISPVTTSQLYEDAPYYVYYRIRKIQNQAWQAYQAFNNSATVTLSTDDAIELLLCTNTSAPTSDSLIMGLMDQETVYVMADGKKGDGGATATVTPSEISVACDNEGNVSQSMTQSLSFGLTIGGVACTSVKGVLKGSAPTGVSVAASGGTVTSVTIATTSGGSNVKDTDIASGVSFTVSGKDANNNDVTADCTLALKGQRKGETGDDSVVYTISCADVIKPGDTTIPINIIRSEGSSIETKTLKKAHDTWGVTITPTMNGGGSATLNTQYYIVELRGVTSTSVLTLELQMDGSTVAKKVVRGVADGESIQGDPGHTGRWYYYDGEYDGTPSNYPMENTQAPYVMYGTYDDGKPMFWMLDFKGEEPSSLPAYATDAPSASSVCWTQMAASQEYYIAKAFFGDYAHLGSFIINGDWMISQHGVIYDDYGDSHTIDDNNSYGGYNVNNAYTIFNASYPNEPDYATNFCPNFAVDGKTGAVYMNNAHVKGEINATSGTFNGTVLVGSESNNQYVKIDSNGLSSKNLYGGKIDGMQILSSGLQRWNARKGAWMPFFSKRVTDVINSNTSITKAYIETYDIILSDSSNGNITLRLPEPDNTFDGQVITIQNIGGGGGERSTTVTTPGGNPCFRADTGNHSSLEISNYERGEFIAQGGYWYVTKLAFS